MSKIFIILILVNLLLCSVLQTNAQTIDITGSLVDSIGNIKLPYGNVILRNQKDSLISGVITTEKGEFRFKNISFKNGMYLLTSYMGYKERRIDLELNNKTKLNVGEIYLTPNVSQIKEAVVEGNINYVENKYDRKVYNMNEGRIAAARTILDLLRALPGVVVDNDDYIRYKGEEATIYIDDQPLLLLYPNIEMVPVDKVDKIELIDASMRSGGDGRGGIINIRFKSVKADGLSGMLSLNTNSISFRNVDKSKEFININYKKKSITFFMNTSFENTNTSTNTMSSSEISAFHLPTIQSATSNDKYEKLTNYNNIGAIYRPSLNTKLYISCGFHNLASKSLSEGTFSENSNIDLMNLNKYRYSILSNGKQLYKSIFISYMHKFDTIDTYIKMYGSFDIYNGSNSPYTLYNYSSIDSKSIDSAYKYNDKMNLYTKGIYYNIFYNHSISKHSRWNLSYNLSIGLGDSTANEHYIFDKLYLPQSQFARNTNQRHDLSWRIGTTIVKWKLDMGVNLTDVIIDGHYTRYNLNDADTVIYLNKNYLKILPSATIAYALNGKEEVKLTLSQTSKFPIFRQLSDYIDKNELYVWKSGNSGLKPVDFYSAYLGYTYNSEKYNASAEYFFNYTSNEISNLSIPLTSLLTLTRQENIANQSNTGVDISFWHMINSKINFSISSSLFHTYYNTRTLSNTAEYYNLPSEKLIKKQYGCNIKYNMEYKLKKFFVMLFFNYNAKELTFDGYNRSWIYSALSVSKKFYTDKLRITIGVNNIFDNMVEHGSYSNKFGIMNNTVMTGSIYKLLYNFSIQYNFRQGDRGTKDL